MDLRESRAYARGYGERPYGYSTRAPPPIYTVDRDPRDKRTRYPRKQREYSDSEISSDSDRSSWNVEDPPDGGQRAWLIVLACGVLHLCSELVYFVFWDTTVIASYRNVALGQRGGMPTKTYDEFMVFEDVRLFGEIIAAIASVFIGYRVVAAFGSVCVGVGFFVASFLNPDYDWEWFGFLVGFLGGIGVSFWRFAAYVAVMEYFKKNRMIAIILSGLGRAIGILVGYGVLAAPFRLIHKSDTTKKDLDEMTDWNVYYKCQMVMVGFAFIASLIIKPLPLARSPPRSEISNLFKLGDTKLCRGGMIFLLLCIYFLYSLGESLPSTTIIYWMTRENFSTPHILGALFAMAIGVLLGYIMLAFWPRQKKLYSTMLWMGLLALLIGLLTLQLPVFTKPFISYVSAYMLILGASQVMFESILRYVIPIAFGRSYIRWVEGLLGLFAGSAAIANNFIARELNKEAPDYFENTFYFAGAAFLACGFVAVVVINLMICFKLKDVNQEKYGPEMNEWDPETRERERERARPPRAEPFRATRRDESPTRLYTSYQYR